MRYIIALLICIPAAEIGFLLLSGKTIGIFPTILLIIVSGVIGAYLAKQQGLETMRRAQEQLQYGQIPGDAILDGICVLIGGTMLLSPGFITDFFGLFLLLPPTRGLCKRLLTKFLNKRLQNGRIKIIR